MSIRPRKMRRRESDTIAPAEAGLPLVEDLVETPTGYELFAALRRAQASRGDRPAIGYAARFEDEAVAIGQMPTMRFEPSEVVDAYLEEGPDRRQRLRVEQVVFGPYGAGGALPQHVAMDALNEIRAGRPWLKGFLDLFTHRMASYLFRAWAAVDLATSREAGIDDGYRRWINSLFGAGPSAFRDRGALADDTKRFLSGLLASRRRSPEVIEQAASIASGVRMEALAHVGEWLSIPDETQARLGQGAARLGQDTTVGPRVHSVSTRFRLRTEPLSLAAFDALLPGGAAHARLVDAMRMVLGLHWVWEVQLVLDMPEVPPLYLDAERRLGLDTWFDGPPAEAGKRDVIITIRPPGAG